MARAARRRAPLARRPVSRSLAFRRRRLTAAQVSATGLPPIVAVRGIVWTETTVAPSIVATRTILWIEPAATGAPTTVPAGECCEPACRFPFASVAVQAVVTGGTRVSWVLDANLADAGPYLLTLQWSASGNPQAGDWVTASGPAAEPAYLVDPVQRVWGVVNLGRYRIVLQTGTATYTSPPVSADGRLATADALWAAELARKERLRYRVTPAGVYGYLLQEKRYGALCSCVDPVTREQRNSSCPVCFGRQYVGGYHPAVACWWTDPTPEDIRKIVDHAGGRGNVADVVRTARTLADFPIAANDVIVLHDSDERYRVTKVTELATVRDVPVILGLEMWKCPRTDVVYRVPVARAEPPGNPCYTPPEATVVCFS